MNNTEQELLASGQWKREFMVFHISEIDNTCPTGVRRLSYDIGDNFTSDQIEVIKSFFDEVNRRFPNIKVFATGMGLVKVEENEE